ncbi:cytochrome d ubiquinol oxidase subunit II [Natronocella acetinitrilica]|uniref:Cytochrome d ubiquinol oxidase subunit II n=1 Tax=Natronocella acetinitrilica TaxID=414046 RepID=A0AAE3G6A4_9GAMM|nr:cytochrome d ubiquinol oxidase subunit II [Natronocella acetinitrilica]MCP1675536.1 cytochrome d ubiquinol oxidase subunit II [Natronocella acetinitrilica]
MEELNVDLTLVWAAIIAFGVFMYVLMDGFDLGVGILFPFAPDEAARDTMMNTVAPVWDGNQTWLVLGGAGLLGAFPLVYSILLPALYLPILFMLIALIFRGVAFEFRFKAKQSKWLWDISFTGGSMLATFMQGVILGAFIQGFEVEGTRFVGGGFDWLTPFSMLTGFGLMAGYSLIGCSWIILKTKDEVRDWAYARAPLLLALVLLFIALVSLWTPLMREAIATRWFSFPNLLYFAPVPLVTVGLALLMIRAIRLREDGLPFVCSLGLFVLCYTGLAISLWPNVIQPDISLWDAASSPGSQLFLLLGVLFVIPIILGYTTWAYWVFRGKVTRDSVGYH